MLLIGGDLIELEALDNGILLLLSNTKLSGILIGVHTQKVLISGEAFPLCDTIGNPLGSINLSAVELVEASPDNLRLDLIGEAFVLIHNQTAMFHDFI